MSDAPHRIVILGGGTGDTLTANRLPGMSSIITHQMARKSEEVDIPRSPNSSS